MNEEDCAGLLAHLRNQLTEIGRRDLDRSAFAGTEGAEHPSEALERYLDTLITGVALESQQGLVRVLGRLGASIGVEEGQGFIDIVVLPAEEDAIARGLERVSLRESLPDRGEFLASLIALQADLREDRGGSESPALE